MNDVIRIGNCSGFYGDRLEAARELIEGGPIDVLTGDYLAELTMSILYGQKKARGEHLGYVGTFLKQVEDVALLCKERGIKIVANAGGLNPKGLAEEIEKVLAKIGVDLKVAYIDGDNLMERFDELEAEGETFTNLDTGAVLKGNRQSPVTANAYLGGWGIKEALDQGADIVICPRVTDAALVLGPAAWKFNWKRDDFDQLAGAIAAGHIIECGVQCSGGNYSFISEVPTFRDMGYPIAEIEADGSFTITKHGGTGGLISAGTVTAQLLYEISAPAYLNPDVTTHFDTLTVEETGPDRVRVTGCKGSNPPPTHKVCVNTVGPYKQSFEVLLTGLDIEKKAEIYIDTVLHNLGGREQFDDVDVQLIRWDKEDPQTNEEAHASLRVTITHHSAEKFGRVFAAKITELGLAMPAGNAGKGGGSFNGGQPIIHWPTTVTSRHITERVHIGDQVIEVLPTQRLDVAQVAVEPVPAPVVSKVDGPTVRVPLGRVFGIRSGDKGGNANIGVWSKTDEGFAWLYDHLTVEEFKRLCPDMADYPVERFVLPNLKAFNFYIRGVLGTGGASNHRIDRLAKSMGEYLGVKTVDLPEAIVPADVLEAAKAAA
jgi:hypothetical protein